MSSSGVGFRKGEVLVLYLRQRKLQWDCSGRLLIRLRSTGLDVMDSTGL